MVLRYGEILTNFARLSRSKFRRVSEGKDQMSLFAGFPCGDDEPVVGETGGGIAPTTEHVFGASGLLLVHGDRSIN
jgi:hypothetical protein